jgi:hypothetical protein
MVKPAGTLSHLNVRALGCVVLGHKWGPAVGVVASYPVIRCARCDRLMNMSAETRANTPWTGRSRSPTGQWSGRVGRGGRPE